MSDEVETVEEEESAPSIGDELRDAIAASDEATEEETEEVKVEPETSEKIPEKEATPEEGVEEATGAVAPEHWPTEERASFDALPEEAKPFAITQGERLYAHHQKRVEDLSSDREVVDRLKQLDQAITPYRDSLKIQGENEVDAVSQLLAIRQSLQTRPLETIKWLASRTGVNLDNLTQDETFADPTESRLNAVEAQVQTVQKSSQQAIQQQQQDIARQNAQSQIDTFAKATSEDGNLKHPHFEAVTETMTAISQGDRAQNKTIDLEDVYQRACWMHGDTREKMLSDRDSKQEATVIAKEKKQRKAHTSRAKRADTTIRSTADAPGKSQLTIREELSQQWDSAAS